MVRNKKFRNEAKREEDSNRTERELQEKMLQAAPGNLATFTAVREWGQQAKK